MKTLASILTATTIAMLMTSCLDNGKNEHNVSYYYEGAANYSYVTDKESGVSTLYPGADYDFKYDLAKGIVTVKISNLQLSALATRVSVLLEKVAFKLDETSAFSINVPDYTSISGGDRRQVSDLKIRQLAADFPAAGLSTTYFSISFTIDNRYEVRMVQRSNAFTGDSKITYIPDGTEKTSLRTCYSYLLNMEKGTATLKITNLPLGGTNYPTLVYENLSFVVGKDGVTVSGNDLIAASGSGASSVELPTLADVNLSLGYAPDMKIDMVTDSGYEVEASISTKRQ